MAYLAAASGKSPSEEQTAVYFDLLGDLPLEALQLAAQRALLESSYPTLPPVGVLRKLAVEAMAGSDRQPTADEAWGEVCRLIRDYGLMQGFEVVDEMPDGPLRRTIKALGWASLCDSTEPEIARAQFRKAYEALREKSDRLALLPPDVREMLAHVAEPAELQDERDPRNAWQVIQDEAARRRRLAAPDANEGG
jgi:hypothetical protein